MSIHSFIHSGHFYFKSSTTQRRSRLQNGYCIGVSRRSAQATAGKELAQGPYVTARAGVEPTTLRLRVIIGALVMAHWLRRPFIWLVVGSIYMDPTNVTSKSGQLTATLSFIPKIIKVVLTV